MATARQGELHTRGLSLRLLFSRPGHSLNSIDSKTPAPSHWAAFLFPFTGVRNMAQGGRP